MAHTNPSPDALRALLTQANTIAMVGASSNPQRPSNGVMRKLQAGGYHVIPVNPNETEVLGEKAYPSLEAIPQKVDIVDVFRRADATPPIADSAVKIGAKVLWLQQGVVNEEAAARAEVAGLTVVMDLCIGVTHALLHVPKKAQAAPS
jgi:predicted CoA-binding protein